MRQWSLFVIKIYFLTVKECLTSIEEVLTFLEGILPRFLMTRARAMRNVIPNEINQRVMSSRWQNRSFLASSPQRTLILTITHAWECLCIGPIVKWRNTSTPLEQKQSEVGPTEEVSKDWWRWLLQVQR